MDNGEWGDGGNKLGCTQKLENARIMAVMVINGNG
jgi:hypothetical protein